MEAVEVFADYGRYDLSGGGDALGGWGGLLHAMDVIKRPDVLSGATERTEGNDWVLRFQRREW